MDYIIGIDGGGTKTIGYIGNTEGKIIGRVYSGSSNYHSIGINKAKYNLEKIIKSLLKKYNVSIDKLVLLSLGLAGVDRPEDIKIIESIVSKLNTNTTYLIHNDARTALVGAHGKSEGIITICGTGSISYGINLNQQIVRAGGWGHLLDDEGSGYDLSIKALKSTVRAYDKLGPETLLSQMILDYLGLNSIGELIQYIYNEETTKDHIAKLSPLVFKASEHGDDVARGIIEQGAASLVKITKSVIDRLYFKNTEIIKLSIDGGIFKNTELMKELFIEQIKKKYNKIEIYNPLFDGAIGALIIGWDYLNVNYNIDKLQEQIKEVK